MATVDSKMISNGLEAIANLSKIAGSKTSDQQRSYRDGGSQTRGRP